MNSFEVLRGQIVARATSAGFPLMRDVPRTLCKCSEGAG